MIELKNLTKRYGTQVAVRDLSLTVGEGELLVLLGGSGSGKTTTLKMINRLIEPSAGSVLVDGQDVGEFEAHDLRRRIGYAFQQVGLFTHMTVAENIGVTPVLLGGPRARFVTGSTSCSIWWSLTRRRPGTAAQTSSPVVSSSVWGLRGRWPPVPVSCCSTNVRRTRPADPAAAARIVRPDSPRAPADGGVRHP